MLARGAGDGTFGEPHLIRTGTARQLAMTDADRDGRLDVVAATDGGVEVVYGRGGAFPEPASRAFPGTWGLAAVDLDRDGRDNLVALATSTDGSTTVVVLRSGNAAVDAYPAPDATSLAAADLDGDRVPDFVCGHRDLSPLFLRGHGDGTFDPPSVLQGLSGAQVLAGDVTGDGVTDLVTWAPLRVAMAAAMGPSMPSPRRRTCPSRPSSRSGTSTATDARTSSTRMPSTALGASPCGRSARTLGDGTFAAPVERIVEGYDLHQLVVDNLDGDGLADLALVTRQTSSLDSQFRLAVLYSDHGVLQPPTWGTHCRTMSRRSRPRG